MLGGPETLMIGKVLWQEFFNNRDWPVASALAVVMLAVLIVPIILFNRNQAKGMNKELLLIVPCHPCSAVARPKSWRARHETFRFCQADAVAGAAVHLPAHDHHGDLLLQRLQAGDGVGRLVHEVVLRPARQQTADRLRVPLLEIAFYTAIAAVALGTVAAFVLTRIPVSVAGPCSAAW